MYRWFLHLAAVVCLLLCLGAAGGWVRSYQRWDRWNDAGGKYFVLNVRGTLKIEWSRDMFSLAQQSFKSGFDWNVLRYEAQSYRGEGPHFRQFVVRYWFLTLLFALGAAFWWGLLWRRRSPARRMGLCCTCGYDLRSHKPGDLCPECGTLVPAAPGITGSP